MTSLHEQWLLQIEWEAAMRERSVISGRARPKFRLRSEANNGKVILLRVSVEVALSASNFLRRFSISLQRMLLWQWHLYLNEGSAKGKLYLLARRRWRSLAQKSAGPTLSSATVSRCAEQRFNQMTFEQRALGVLAVAWGL